eukprot:scaffold22580_cov91-Isochrysis_galbana.AAC.3
MLAYVPTIAREPSLPHVPPSPTSPSPARPCARERPLLTHALPHSPPAREPTSPSPPARTCASRATSAARGCPASHVVARRGQHAHRLAAVAPRPADLLEVVLEPAGRRHVVDQLYPWWRHAHPKSLGTDQNLDLTGEEAVKLGVQLGVLAYQRGHVIRQRRHPIGKVIPEALGDGLHLLLGLAVDDGWQPHAGRRSPRQKIGRPQLHTGWWRPHRTACRPGVTCASLRLGRTSKQLQRIDANLVADGLQLVLGVAGRLAQPDSQVVPPRAAHAEVPERGRGWRKDGRAKGLKVALVAADRSEAAKAAAIRAAGQHVRPVPRRSASPAPLAPQAQAVHYVAARLARGRRRQRQHRRPAHPRLSRQVAQQVPDFGVLGPEAVIPPRGYQVRLVDSNQPHRPMPQEGHQHLAGGGRSGYRGGGPYRQVGFDTGQVEELLGGDVDEDKGTRQPADNVVRLRRVEPRGDRRMAAGGSQIVEALHLLAHQRTQGRHHQHEG